MKKRLDSMLSINTTARYGVVLLLLLCLTDDGSRAAEARAQESYGSHFVVNSNNPRVVVFLHGLYGKAATTWRNVNGFGWPEAVASDPAFPRTDIFVAGYPTPEHGNSRTIADLANIVYQQLGGAGIFTRREIVFEVHSLGGLVLDRLLLDHPDMASKVRFAVYYGTPHQGSFVANFAKIFDDDPLLHELVGGDGATYLVSLDKEWRQAGLEIPRYCAYEEEDTAASGFLATLIHARARVVGYYSATYRCDATVPAQAIPTDHIAMVKPANNQDPAYTFLRRLVEQHPIQPVYGERVVPRDVSSWQAVDCNHTNSSGELPDRGCFLIRSSQSGSWVQARRLKALQISREFGFPTVARLENNTAHISYGFNGLDRNWLGNCPGGGHATLVTHFQIAQRIIVTE